MTKVFCLETKYTYTFSTDKSLMALIAMQYYLNLNKKLDESIIHKTKSRKHLWFEADGKTYCVVN